MYFHRHIHVTCHEIDDSDLQKNHQGVITCGDDDSDVGGRKKKSFRPPQRALLCAILHFSHLLIHIDMNDYHFKVESRSTLYFLSSHRLK